MFDSYMARLAKLQREKQAVKNALISDAAKAVLGAQIDAALRVLEAEIASSGAVQAPSSGAGTRGK